jgi:hypothetical protein
MDDMLRAGGRAGPLEVIGVSGPPGEVALCWHERKVLIIGDAIIGNPPGQCGLLPEKVVNDPSWLRESVR